MNGPVGGIYSSVVPLYLVTLPRTAPCGLLPLQKNGGEGDAICFWILHHRLMRHREVMRGEWNWWPFSGVEYWSVHLYLVHTLEDSMAVTIGYYRHKSSAELKKALEAWYFQNWMIWVEFTMWPTFVQKTNCLFFFAFLSERSPTYIQAVSYVLATSKRSWSGGSTCEDMTLMHREYVMPCTL